MQRWLKMAKYLPEFGYQPVVLTPLNPDFELKDESLLADVPAEAEVLQVPIWEPFGLYRRLRGKKAVQKQGVVDTQDSSLAGRLSRWVRGNWFVPDARLFWIRPAVKYLSSYLKKHPVEAIITTGPPHSMHLIGLEIKRRTGINWIADFRDPWSQWDVLPQLNLGKAAWKTHKKLEKQVLTNADKVITVTQNLAQSLKTIGNLTHVKVITNGYDAVDFKASAINTTLKKFSIAHVGLLNQGRNPAALWQVLHELCIDNELFEQKLEVVLAGTIDQAVRDDIARWPRLAKKVTVVDYLPHSEVINLYHSSAVLLLLVNNTSNASWILPGKLFEYFSAQKPILPIGKPGIEADEVLATCGYPGFVDYNDVNTLKDRVLELFSAFRRGTFTMDSKNTHAYERKELTRQLANFLDNMLGS